VTNDSLVSVSHLTDLYIYTYTCRKLRVIFLKRAIDDRALLRTISFEDQAS